MHTLAISTPSYLNNNKHEIVNHSKFMNYVQTNGSCLYMYIYIYIYIYIIWCTEAVNHVFKSSVKIETIKKFRRTFWWWIVPNVMIQSPHMPRLWWNQYNPAFWKFLNYHLPLQPEVFIFLRIWFSIGGSHFLAEKSKYLGLSIISERWLSFLCLSRLGSW